MVEGYGGGSKSTIPTKPADQHPIMPGSARAFLSMYCTEGLKVNGQALVPSPGTQNTATLPFSSEWVHFASLLPLQRFPVYSNPVMS